MTTVAIGSFALSHYFPDIKFRDKDYITTPKFYQSDRYYIGRYRRDKIDVSLTTKHKSNQLIFDFCNQNKDQCIEKVIEGQKGYYSKPDFNYLIPPLKILYAIYKSHIHRMIPYTEIQSKNIEVWAESVNKYNLIRNRIGYKHLDDIMFEPKLGKLVDFNTMPDRTNDEILNKAMVQIYTIRFKETNEKFADTTVSLDKPEAEFFKDAVPRLIEHDELHKKVALAYRETDELLFVKFQQDGKENVSMDRELFNDADNSTKVQCIFEEVVVLFLERKWLLEIKNNFKDRGHFYNKTNYDIDLKREEIVNTICHFATNLCGNGQSWLRRWVLDHYMLISNLDLYDFSKIYNIAIPIVYTPEEIIELQKKTENTDPQKWLEVYKEFIKTIDDQSDRTNQLMKDVLVYCPSARTTPDPIIFEYFIGTANNLYVKKYTFDKQQIIIKLNAPVDLIDMLNLYRPGSNFFWRGEYDIIINNFGFGLCLGAKKITAFKCTVKSFSMFKDRNFETYDIHSTDEKVFDRHTNHVVSTKYPNNKVNWDFKSIVLSDPSLEIQHYEKGIVTDYYLEYYSSMDPECEGMSEVDYTFPVSKYISSFGSCPYFLKDIDERCTHCLVDQKAPDSGDHGYCLEIQGGISDASANKSTDSDSW